jgi:hypothetical protein
MRSLYYWDSEQKKLVESRPRPAEEKVHVIGDEMPAVTHPSNGKYYTSKSKFRAETRARGLTEVGNEYSNKPKEFFAPQPRFADPLPVMREIWSKQN